MQFVGERVRRFRAVRCSLMAPRTVTLSHIFFGSQPEPQNDNGESGARREQKDALGAIARHTRHRRGAGTARGLARRASCSILRIQIARLVESTAVMRSALRSASGARPGSMRDFNP